MYSQIETIKVVGNRSTCVWIAALYIIRKGACFWDTKEKNTKVWSSIYFVRANNKRTTFSSHGCWQRGQIYVSRLRFQRNAAELVEARDLNSSRDFLIQKWSPEESTYSFDSVNLISSRQVNDCRTLFCVCKSDQPYLENLISKFSTISYLIKILRAAFSV
jgi:hypothetical protein